MDRPSPGIEDGLLGIRLVMMDIDGTLITADRNTFDNVLDQLRKLKRFNVRFSLTTGRTLAGALPILDRLQSVGMRLPPLVTYNGGVVVESRGLSVLSRHNLSRDDYRAVIEMCRDEGVWPLAYGCRETITGAPRESVYIDSAAPPVPEFNGMETLRTADLLDVPEEIVAVLIDAGDLNAGRELAIKFAKLLGDRVRVTTSGSHYVEICSHQATKTNAMRRVASLLSISTEEILAIGDNLNDLEMIESAGVGVAVGNAPESVKAVADYICSRNSAEGVVEVLRLLVRVRSNARIEKSRKLLCQPQNSTSSELQEKDSLNAF